jgi:hypothetical protein
MTNQNQQRKSQVTAQPARCIESQIRSNNTEEFLSIFAPLTVVIMLMALAKSSMNPGDMMQMLGNAGEDGKDQPKMATNKISEHERTKPKHLKNIRIASLKDIEHRIPVAAQREMMQRYLSSGRPAAFKEVALPKSALRTPS